MKREFYYLMILGIFFQTHGLLAQSKVLEKTNYVGALNIDASKDWTQSWTNWDPKSTDYPAVTDITTLDGMATSLPVPGKKEINGTLNLDANQVYLLKGIIVVSNGGKLVIPAGTVIRGEADLNASPKNYACIVIERGGKIELNGTASKPVVFTSNKAIGQRERGDWGGLLIAGRAVHNLSNATFDNVQMEGFNNITFDGSLAKFGGNDATDNSGVLKYLRIEFAGLAFETNKEINGLTLGAVGSGTEMHHVQVSYSNDDSFEWFGGSVNSKYLIAYKGTDDDFDTDNGYNGINQFGIAVRDSVYYDLTFGLPSGSSTSEGFESDNEASGTANVQPYTSAIFSNFTMVGPVPEGTKYTDLNSTARSAFRRGARIRRNSSLRIVNSIFMGYRNFLMMDGDSSLRNTNDPGLLAILGLSPVDAEKRQASFNNNIIVNTANAYTSTTDTTANGLVEVARAKGSDAKLKALDAFVRQSGCLANNINPVAFVAGTLLENASAYTTTPNFRPVAGSPALLGAEFECNPVLKNLITSSKEIEKANESISVYPNPVVGDMIYFGKYVESFGLFDLSGKLLLHGFDTDQVKVGNLQAGVYFIKMEGHISKVIIE